MTTPDLAATYALFISNFDATLNPIGVLERTFASEISRAAWRLQKYAIREAALLAAESTPSIEADLTAINRSRANSLNIMNKATRELRLLQTERQTRNEIFPAGTDLSNLGLARIRDIVAVQIAQQRLGELIEKARKVLEEEALSDLSAAIDAPLASFCKTPAQPADPLPSLARNSLCPCNSGQKYKRCCGVNAPPVLGKAA